MNTTGIGLYEIQGMHLPGVRIGKSSLKVMAEAVEPSVIPNRQFYGISHLASYYAA